VCARREAGLSLLEFTLVVIVIAALAALAAERITAMQLAMERAAVQRTVAAMRTAHAMEFAAAVAQGRREEIGAWQGGNALTLIEGREVLAGAAQGDDAAPAAEVAVRAARGGVRPGPGRWYYDAERAEVVYRVAYAASGAERAAEGRWRVVVEGDDAPRGLALVNVQPPQW